VTTDLSQTRQVFEEIQEMLGKMGVTPVLGNIAIEDQLRSAIRSDLLGVGLDPVDENVLAGTLGGLLIMVKMVMPLVEVVPHFSLSIINQACALSRTLNQMLEDNERAFDVPRLENHDQETEVPKTPEPEIKPVAWWKRTR